jgi:hypothetical protein
MSPQRVLTGWLALVVTYTLVQTASAHRVTGALGMVATGIRRLSDPTVALVPDHSGQPTVHVPGTGPLPRQPGDPIPAGVVTPGLGQTPNTITV